MRRPAVINKESLLLDALSVEAALTVNQSLKSDNPVRRTRDRL